MRRPTGGYNFDLSPPPFPPTQPQMHVLKPKLSPDSEEYVLEQLSVVEQKLVGVAEELASRDQDTIRKEMEDEEVRREVARSLGTQVMLWYLLSSCSSIALWREAWQAM